MNEEHTYAIANVDLNQLTPYFRVEDWSEYFWGFTCYSRQEYAEKLHFDGVDEIMVGIQSAQGGCLCELAFRWYVLDNVPTPRLEVFSDAWPVLQTPVFAEIMKQITEMANFSEPTPSEVSAVLIANSFKDQSDYPLDISEEIGRCNDGTQ